MKTAARKNDETDPIVYVNKRVDPHGQQAERVAFEQQWMVNIGLFLGAMFVQDGRLIREPRSLTQKREAYNANLILPKVMRYLAKLESVNPVVKVLPNTDRWQDIQGARAGELVYAHARYVSGHDEARSRALMFGALCGSGFTKVSWDPTKGKADRIYLDQGGRPNPMVIYDPDARAFYEQNNMYRDVYPGEIVSELVEPWQLWPDPNARGGGIGDCRWVAIVTANHVDAIYDETGIRVEPEPNSFKGAELYREVLAFMAAGQSGVAPLGLRPRVSECARDIEIFERPSRRYPRGRYVRVAGGAVIEDRENPYATTSFPIPIFKYDGFPTESRFWGISLVELLRSPQKAYNSARSHMMNMQKTAGHAPVFIQKNSGITPRQIKGLHGLILEYSQTSVPPMFGQPPSLPNYIGENGAMARSEMNEISAQTDPANSKLPGQLRSGSAIAAVQADSNLILTPTTKRMLKADQHVGQMMLELAGKWYTERRMMSVVGPSGEVEPRYLRGADIRNNYSLRVISQPGELESAESRTANVLDAIQLQALNPRNPEDRMIVLKALRFHTGDDAINSLLVQDTSEQRAIQQVIESNGDVEPPMYPWYDPFIRSKVLERRLNSREFELYPDAVKAILAKRWAMFSQEAAKRTQAQLEAMKASNGAPAEKGTPSQPSR